VRTGALTDAGTTGRLRSCCDVLLAKKAFDVVVLHVTAVTSVADHFVIASGFSRTQVQSLADSVRERMERDGWRELRSEGYPEARWVCLDYGDVVVHVFLDEVRRYFDLERLWSDAPRERLTEAAPA
jgi:ribosome-associated protein